GVEGPLMSGGGFFSSMGGGLSSLFGAGVGAEAGAGGAAAGIGSSIMDFLPMLFSFLKEGGPVTGKGYGMRLPWSPALSFASGGEVPIFATPGEYVMNPFASSKLGRSALDYMNR